MLTKMPETEWTIPYLIDRAYQNADRYLQGSDNWHYWMDEAKRLTDKLHGRN